MTARRADRSRRRLAGRSRHAAGLGLHQRAL